MHGGSSPTEESYTITRRTGIKARRGGPNEAGWHVADQLRPKWLKLAAFIDDSETDVLSYLDFPEQHRSKLHSTNPLERLNKEVKRRADVVGIFPNDGRRQLDCRVLWHREPPGPDGGGCRGGRRFLWTARIATACRAKQARGRAYHCRRQAAQIR